MFVYLKMSDYICKQMDIKQLNCIGLFINKQISLIFS